MLKETNFKQDKLYNGLPCVWDGKKYLIFSPYAQKIAELLPQQLDEPSSKKKLEDMGFFERLQNKNNEEIAKISLSLTTDCNLNCRYCYVENKDKPVYMQPEFAIRALKETIKSPIKKIYITFFGGEPTLNMPVLETSLDYIKSSGIKGKFHIVTNGVISQKNLDYLVDNRFTFTVSMDGTPEINDVQRPTKSKSTPSKEIIKTINTLVQEGNHFQIRMTITNFNVNHITQAIEYFASLGVKFVHFEPVSIAKNNFPAKFSIPNADIYIKNVISALDKAEELGIYVINSAYMNLLTPSKHFCTLTGGERFLFTPDGGVSLCYRVQNPDDAFKDFIIGKYNSKADKFEIDPLKLRKFANINVNAFKKCENCFAKYICGSGCPYRNFTQTGSFQKVDNWMCDVKKELIHDAIIRIYESSKRSKESVVLGTNIFENMEN